jgi:ferric-dicitrate binding protein FerR (iron transport regulator)
VTTVSCERWSELTDRQLIGETPLDASELEQVRAHELSCRQCGREATALRALRPASLHLAPDEEEVRRILLRAEVDSLSAPSFTATGRRSSPAPKPLTWLASGAGVVALAATAALVVDWWVKSDLNQLDASAATLTAATRVAEDSCGTLAPGVRVCVAAGSEVGVMGFDGTRRFLELKRGRAITSFEPSTVGAPFAIVAKGAEVSASGAQFSVEQLGEQTWVRVARGSVSVSVQGSSTPRRVLHAGQKLLVGAANASELSPEDARADLELIARFDAATEASSAPAAAR